MQHELSTDAEPSSQSRATVDLIRPNLLRFTPASLNNCIGLDTHPSASESRVHTPPVLIVAPLARILTELDPSSEIVPAIRVAFEFMVIDVSMIRSCAVFVVESSVAAESTPSIVLEFMLQIELAMLVSPIVVTSHDAETALGNNRAITIRQQNKRPLRRFIY